MLHSPHEATWPRLTTLSNARLIECVLTRSLAGANPAMYQLKAERLRCAPEIVAEQTCWRFAAKYAATQPSPAQPGTAWHGTARHGTARHGTAV